MRHIKLLLIIGIVINSLSACGPATTNVPETATNPLPKPTSTSRQPENTETPTLAPLIITPLPLDTNTPNAFPLSELGAYHIGKRTYGLEDPNRNGRGIDITIWYPAIPPEGTTVNTPHRDAEPDFRDAPYPLILSSTKLADILARFVVTHGFVWVSVDNIDAYEEMNEEMIDQPLDILYALNQVAANPPDGLEGMIDALRTGTIGYSFDGYNSLAMSGARIDPDFYLAQCEDPNAKKPHYMSAFSCGPAHAWEAYEAHAGEVITASEDGLWQAMTDERIRAVMPMAGEGWWLFGERGLAPADRPVLIIAATKDELYPENALIYEHLGTTDKTFISFVGPGHMMIYDSKMVKRMAHFAVAYFGYYLQGKEDLKWYFSEEFVEQFDDLAWGVYKGNE